MTTDTMERRIPNMEDPTESEAVVASSYFVERTGEPEADRMHRCRITGAYCDLDYRDLPIDCRRCNFALAYMLNGRKPSRLGL